MDTNIADTTERRIIIDAGAAELRVIDGDKTKAPPGSEGKQITGYAVKFNKRSQLLWDTFFEIIAPGAFATDLSGNPDIRFLLNHDPNVVMGRTVSNTLRVYEDSIGLAFSVWPPDTNTARDLITVVKRGDISQCSFAYRAIKDDWVEDRETGKLIRTVLQATLSDVCLATYPAYLDSVAVVSKRTLDAAQNKYLAFNQAKALPGLRARELALAEREIL